MLSFRLSARSRSARRAKARERPAQAAAHRLQIEFKARDERNERGTFGRTLFEFPCEVAASWC